MNTKIIDTIFFGKISLEIKFVQFFTVHLYKMFYMEILTKSTKIAHKRKKSGKEQKTARFDAKLTLAQKELFLQAATLKGFRSLTDFVVSTVQEKAQSIIKEHSTILASEKDKDIFFEALLNPKEPGAKLIEAAKQYKALINK